MAERFLEPSALFGQSLPGNFVLTPPLVKESICSTVTELVTNDLKKPSIREPREAENPGSAGNLVSTSASLNP